MEGMSGANGSSNGKHKNGQPPQPAATQEQPAAGVLGDGELRAGKHNMALVRRAINEGWPIPEDVRQRLIEQMAKIIDAKKSQMRNRISAAKVLVAADAINAKREATDAATERAGMNVNVNVGVQAAFKVYAGFDPEQV